MVVNVGSSVVLDVLVVGGSTVVVVVVPGHAGHTAVTYPLLSILIASSTYPFPEFVLTA